MNNLLLALAITAAVFAPVFLFTIAINSAGKRLPPPELNDGEVVLDQGWGIVWRDWGYRRSGGPAYLTNQRVVLIPLKYAFFGRILPVSSSTISVPLPLVTRSRSDLSFPLGQRKVHLNVIDKLPDLSARSKNKAWFQKIQARSSLWPVESSTLDDRQRQQAVQGAHQV